MDVNAATMDNPIAIPSEKYVVVTPVRDEREHIEKTIHSMIEQTVRPLEWVIVNDGSTDMTGEIIDQYAKKHSWIRVVHRDNRGFRKAGGGVIDAFYDGYQSLQEKNWDFIVKLDGDLSFASDYFERCFEIFKKNKKLGIGGGTIYNLIKGNPVIEEGPLFHVRGATKIYRKECWEGIGKLINAPGWDTLDEVKANMLGWKTMSFNGIQVIHHRFTGQADGTWQNWVKNGRANYISGYHPLFMIAKCIKRIFERPYLISAIGLSYGFVSGYWKSIPQIEDADLIKYLRKQQIRKLTLGDSIWH